MFRRDHSSTDSQFVLIEKNPHSGEIVEEPFLEPAISSSPPYRDSSLSSSPSSTSSSSNHLGVKLRDKISKNLRPGSYLNPLASNSSTSVATSTSITQPIPNQSLQVPSTHTLHPSNSFGSFHSQFAPSSPNQQSFGFQVGAGLSPPTSSCSSLNSLSPLFSPANRSAGVQLPLNTSSPSLNSPPLQTPPKEMLEVLASVDPTNKRLNGDSSHLNIPEKLDPKKTQLASSIMSVFPSSPSRASPKKTTQSFFPDPNPSLSNTIQAESPDLPQPIPTTPKMEPEKSTAPSSGLGISSFARPPQHPHVVQSRKMAAEAPKPIDPEPNTTSQTPTEPILREPTPSEDGYPDSDTDSFTVGDEQRLSVISMDTSALAATFAASPSNSSSPLHQDHAATPLHYQNTTPSSNHPALGHSYGPTEHLSVASNGYRAVSGASMASNTSEWSTISTVSNISGGSDISGLSFGSHASGNTVAANPPALPPRSIGSAPTLPLSLPASAVSSSHLPLNHPQLRIDTSTPNPVAPLDSIRSVSASSRLSSVLSSASSNPSNYSPYSAGSHSKGLSCDQSPDPVSGGSLYVAKRRPVGPLTSQEEREISEIEQMLKTSPRSTSQGSSPSLVSKPVPDDFLSFNKGLQQTAKLQPMFEPQPKAAVESTTPPTTITASEQPAIENNLKSMQEHDMQGPSTHGTSLQNVMPLETSCSQPPPEETKPRSTQKLSLHSAQPKTLADLSQPKPLAPLDYEPFLSLANETSSQPETTDLNPLPENLATSHTMDPSPNPKNLVPEAINVDTENSEADNNAGLFIAGTTMSKFVPTGLQNQAQLNASVNSQSQDNTESAQATNTIASNGEFLQTSEKSFPGNSSHNSLSSFSYNASASSLKINIGQVSPSLQPRNQGSTTPETNHTYSVYGQQSNFHESGQFYIPFEETQNQTNPLQLQHNPSDVRLRQLEEEYEVQEQKYKQQQQSLYETADNVASQQSFPATFEEMDEIRKQEEAARLAEKKKAGAHKGNVFKKMFKKKTEEAADKPVVVAAASVPVDQMRNLDINFGPVPSSGTANPPVLEVKDYSTSEPQQTDTASSPAKTGRGLFGHKKKVSNVSEPNAFATGTEPLSAPVLVEPSESQKEVWELQAEKMVLLLPDSVSPQTSKDHNRRSGLFHHKHSNEVYRGDLSVPGSSGSLSVNSGLGSPLPASPIGANSAAGLHDDPAATPASTKRHSRLAAFFGGSTGKRRLRSSSNASAISATSAVSDLEEDHSGYLQVQSDAANGTNPSLLGVPGSQSAVSADVDSNNPPQTPGNSTLQPVLRSPYTATNGDSTTAQNIAKQTYSKEASEMLQKAIDLHEAGDLTAAAHMFKELSDPNGINHPLAQVLYGLSLRHGWGIPIDEGTAFQYLRLAGQNSAMLHHVVDHQQPSGTAGKTKRPGVARDELTLATYELGNCFRNGWGCERDPVAAFNYYKTAAQMGDLDAMTETAWCYMNGFGTPNKKKDKFQAVQYYRMAHKKGKEEVGSSWIWKEKYDVKN